ncbi:ComF family protein [Polaribacter aquimarinus]|uniref:Amidophosphoribosyltransferase n=1 Tax=Polaribacter aquimarinus TaxID=2100726 RepID=A0A2U2JCW7_9FLAO|nr:phosphoribosyltransferase family protein [Polaribacter aquimarinus]PWG06152.1 amidophosphoribosyltransferase [Polaribacter aquimarinus]
MKIFKNLFKIFYPELCINCDTNLLQNEDFLCTFCRHDLPLTNFIDFENNKVKRIFDGRVSIDKANSLFYFRKEGITQKLIHQLKYKENEKVGVFFGDWQGEILKETKEFNHIDIIIPVPLHPIKLKKRGYNQVSKYGYRLSYYLNKPFVQDVLIRISTSKTQTFKSRFERFNNNETKFLLKNTKTLAYKNILLIDDVVTTGATLEACIKELQKSKGIKISILTMAYTE